MSNAYYTWSLTRMFSIVSHKDDKSSASPPVSQIPTGGNDGGDLSGRSLFWRDRLFEVGLVLAMALYYIIGNQDLKYPIGNFAQWNPLLAIPFLIVFVILCWFRLPAAVTLLPLALPFYLAPKTVIRSGRFSPAEIILWICLLVACAQWLVARVRHERWRYSLSLSELRERIGPFLIPIVVFVLAAVLSIFVANAHSSAERAFREEVLDPLLYVGLLFCCLRTRSDLTRLLYTFFAIGFFIACFACVQYKLIGKTYTVYGSPNSTGLLFDYTLPVGLALAFSRRSWKVRVAALLLCLPFFYALLHSESRGSAWFAFPIVFIFVLVLAIRNRKVLLIGSAIVIVLAAAGYGLFSHKVNTLVMDKIINGHSDSNNVSTLQRREYLWESALAMIHDNPILGYGMDNWLCHYADPHDPRVIAAMQAQHPDWTPYQVQHPDWVQACTPVSHYYIVADKNGKTTHMTDEPSLSHPHDIFLHVWVSMGIFGLLAFVVVLVLFFWLFGKLLSALKKPEVKQPEHLRWMVVGVGGGLLAGMIQGLVDSAFLEQDLAFCFWLLVGSLLLLRFLVGMPWSAMFHSRQQAQIVNAE